MKARSTYVALHIKVKIASHQVTMEKLARLLGTIVEKVFFRLKVVIHDSYLSAAYCCNFVFNLGTSQLCVPLNNRILY